jgi:hypothetical protein
MGHRKPRPAQEAGAEGRHQQAGDITADQLQGRTDANSRLGVLGEGREAIELLEDGQIALGVGQELKATEVLVVLIEALDDEFNGVVGQPCGLHPKHPVSDKLLRSRTHSIHCMGRSSTW